MNFKKTILVFILLFTVNVIFANVEHILPRPHQITVSEGSFNLTQPIQLILPTIGNNDPSIDTELITLVTSNGGSVSSTAPVLITVQLVASVAGAESQDEAYSLTVATDKITIKAVTLKGAYWAVQTLLQLAEQMGGQLPVCSVTDWAAFRIRGYMHDIGRSYIQFDELKNEIVKLSRFKINVFHWHLTDNQGWRLESRIYPQLNANGSYTRMPGQYYTIAQAKELVTFANKHGVTIIPEMDMPGHSQAFRTAMGHSMLTDAGLTEMKALMTEACTTFADTPWIHIGTDELRAEDKGTIDWTVFVPQMVAHIRAQGKKVVSWSPGYSYSSGEIDMTQMWSSSGKVTADIPAIDSRYYYINHFDQFADIVGIYNSNIAAQEKGSQQYAGVIIGVWNDRIMPNDKEIINQNAFYASMLAIAERAWLGGGGAYIPQKGVMIDPLDVNFSDWEKRFLYHKSHFLKDEPIAYVKQTNVRWRITDAFANSGNLATVFPPETSIPATSYTYNNATYNTRTAIGAGIYLRHVWGTLIPAFYTNPQVNSTAYAYTYVYSPTTQTVGALIEFQNYGRSESDLPAPQGQWDYNQSKIWINDALINPPTWINTHTSRNNEVTLKNENFPARAPIPVTLNQGWNKVLIKLPVGAFSLSAIRLVKWMYTCVFVTTDGKNAVDGLIYSPDKNLNPSLDLLILAIDKANSTKNSATIGYEPGKYSSDKLMMFQAQIDAAIALRNNNSLTDAEYKTAAETLISQTQQFKQSINYPQISTDVKQYWYSLSTPLRDATKFIAYQGDNAALIGQAFVANNNNFLWKITSNSDGTYNIVSKAANSHIDQNSAYNTALKAQAGVPVSDGWNLTPLYTNAYFIITNREVQFNQTTATQNYQLYNWGGGKNLIDAGCQFFFRLESLVGADAVDSLQMTIDNTYNFLNSTQIGTEPGQYTADNRTQLTDAMIAASAIKNNVSSAVSDLRQAKQTLLTALNTYKQSINMAIGSDDKTTVWYSITSVRENRSVSYQGNGNPLIGNTYVEGNDAFLWKLVKLADNTYSIINKTSDNYITTVSPKLTAAAGTQIAGGWAFTPINLHNYFIITSGASQFNQGNAGTAYAINNWGNGTNTTDSGCQYFFTTKQTVISGITQPTLNNEKVWIENGFLRTTGDLNKLSVFTSGGQQLNAKTKLSKGVVLVKSVTNTVKLIVK